MKFPNNQEPEMGKNFWLALALSFLVVVSYPLFLKWMNPASSDKTALESSAEINSLESEDELTAPAALSEESELKAKEESSSIQTPMLPDAVEMQNDFFDLRYTTLGGTLSVLYYRGEKDHHVETETLFFEEPVSVPGLFGIKLLHSPDDLTQTIFQIVEQDPAQMLIRFAYEVPGEYRMIKTYKADPAEPVLHLSVTVENISSRPRHFPLQLEYGLDIDHSDATAQQHQEAVLWTEKAEFVNLGKIKKKGYSKEETIRWSGFTKKYFALLVNPQWETARFTTSANTETMSAALMMEPITLQPGEKRTKEIFVYAGPQRYETLKSYEMGFESILSKGFFGMFKIWLLLTLKFLNQFAHNYGLSIILLTLLIKGLFAPLTHISYKSMKKMQVIQPKIKSLQERYKKDPEKLNREMMELFKRNRVNPMAGCLPMLIQMPVLFAMFRLLPEAIELKGAPFIWWINDLSQPDRLMELPFSVPFLGWSSLNILPILMIISQFGYQKIMPQTSTNPEQQKIMNFMPIFFGFICYNMPSGLVLYWFVQNLLTIIQQVFVNRIVVVLHHEDRD